MKNNCNLLFISLSILFSLDSYSQEKTVDILNSVSSNIISHKIIKNIDTDVEDNFILSNETPSFFKYIPNISGNLKLKLKKEEISYPKKGYNLYSVYHKNYEIEYDNFKTVLNSVDGYIPGKGKYLIAYNEINKKIKYISGNFFLSFISEDFSLNKKAPKTYIDYVKLKTFTLNTINIEYLRRNLSFFIFKAFSKEKERDILIYIKKRKPDIILIKEL